MILRGDQSGLAWIAGRNISNKLRKPPSKDWLLAQKPWIVPIPGTTKLERLSENIGSASVELTSGDLLEIETAASKIKVQGGRYPESSAKLVGK